jgi:putative transposase
MHKAVTHTSSHLEDAPVKEECVWQHNFQDFKAANRAVARWLAWYNHERPHQSLGYRSPVEFRAQQLQLVA